MKIFYTLKTVIITLVIFTFGLQQSNAQVGIGNTAPSTTLDITAINPTGTATTVDGILIPRVDRQRALGMTAIPTSTLIYVNSIATGTATGIAVNITAIGFYTFDGTTWQRIVSGATTNWALAGNGGTVAATNFVGTTDAIDLSFRTNNTEKVRIGANGSVAINTAAAPSSFEKLQVNHTGFANDAILARNNDSATGKGNALWAINGNATGTSIIASGGAIPPSVIPSLGAGISGSHVDGYGVYANTGNGNPATTAHNGHAAGGFLLDNDNNATTAGSSAYAKLAGKDNGSPDGILSAQDILYGGYFQGGVTGQAYSYAGLKYNHDAAGGGGTNYKIIGSGAASTIIPDLNNKPRVMFCPEAPEVLFEDYGISKLSNGEAFVTLDKILTMSMKIDEQHPLKVFIQLEGDCNGVFVTEKSSSGFRVKELNKGRSSVNFSWHIVGNRADSKDANGNINSEFENLRLPIGPGLLKEDKLAQKESPKTK